MAEINSILETSGTALADSTAIRNWSRVQYEQACTIFENCDPRDTPPAEACPLIILSAVSKYGGLSQPAKLHHVGVSCVVHDDGKSESIQGVVRFKGGRLVEELRILAVNVIADNAPAGLIISELSTEYSTIEEFPLVSANMVIEFREKQVLGISNNFIE